MSSWEFWTWIALLILGPGALVIFFFFLRDAKRILQEIKNQAPGK